MRKVWAVAVNTVKQALRLKVAAAFVVLLVVLLVVMSWTVTGDGTLRGQLQTFVSYGISLTNILLSTLTIIVSVYTLCSDFAQRQVYTVLTKPIRRYQLIAGKFLGVLILDAMLLVFFGGVIYAVAIGMPYIKGSSEEEIGVVKNEFYTARRGLVREEFDVSAEVEREYDRLRRTGQLPQGVSERKIREDLTEIRQRQKLSASVGEAVSWHFDNVAPFDPNEELYVKFKYDVSVNPPDLQVYSRWVIGGGREFEEGSDDKIYIIDRKDIIRTNREFRVPVDALTEDGHLSVRFLNIPLNDTVVMFPPQDGFEVLYKAGTFTGNFVRGLMLIFFRLVFLICLGLAAGSFLSFPVAVLFCFAIFFTSILSGFVLESIQFLEGEAGAAYNYTIKPLIHFLPRFDRFNPSEFLVSASYISWSLVGEAVGIMVFVKSGILLLISMVIFGTREIARVII